MSGEPRKGDFGGGALAGGRVVDPAEFVDNRPYFGLHREAGYLWGALRDDDLARALEGDRLEAVRAVWRTRDGGDALLWLGAERCAVGRTRPCRRARASRRSRVARSVRDRGDRRS